MDGDGEIGSTNDTAVLAERFEANRSHLRAVAHRMLGSAGEATMRCRRPGCVSAAPMRRGAACRSGRRRSRRTG